MNILNKLTIKHMMMNKKRTIVTIIGVILSSVLLFSVGFYFSTIRKNAIDDVCASGGSQHITIQNYPYMDLGKLEEKGNLSIQSYEEKIYEENTTYQNIYLLADSAIDTHVHLMKGTYPKKNEVIVSMDFIQLDGENQNRQIGSMITIGQEQYTISGIYDSATTIGYHYDSSYQISDMYFFTEMHATEESLVDVRIVFRKTKNVYEQIARLGMDLGYKIHYTHDGFTFDEIVINNRLLELYGQSNNAGIAAIFFLSLLLLLTVLGVVCIFVIYNSFAISVAERKKMFGMFSSVGATPRQIFISVFYEAFLVGLIAIPIGFILSLGIVGSVLLVLNTILKDITQPYHLHIYPQYLLVSFLFLLLTLFLSALFPATRASEATPIASMRLQGDIKRKTVKRTQWIRKLFGIEGELAYKNRKRNRKKYRVTIISISVSIVLFLTVSTYINYFMKSSLKEEQIEPDVSISLPISEKTEQVIQQIQKIDSIKESIVYQSMYIPYVPLEEQYYTDAYLAYRKQQSFSTSLMRVVVLDRNSYQTYQKKVGIQEEKPILYNTGIFYNYQNGKSMDFLTVFDVEKRPSFSFCEKQNTPLEFLGCINPITSIHYTDISLFQTYYMKENPGNTLVVNADLYDRLSLLNANQDNVVHMMINTYSIKSFDKKMKEVIQKYPEISIIYYSVKLERYEFSRMILAFQFALYSFTFLIALIAVTSAISTIYTSIQLRRVEFSVLRSVGLSQKGLMKMLRLESFFFAIRALIIGLSVSFVLIAIIQKMAGLGYGENKIVIPFPTTYVIICVVGVFCIVCFAMHYSVKKMKKDNIIDAIEQENI